MSLRVAVFISGRGSNMVALAEEARRADSHFQIVGVFSNKPDALGLKKARDLGLPVAASSHKDYQSRQAFEAEIQRKIAPWQPDLICLAGFMRIFSPHMLSLYDGRILNIHPSLLPLFPGLHPHRQALQAGVKVHGCTVHKVTSKLDAGPILGQAVVPVLASDTEESLAARVIVAELQLYSAVVTALAKRRLNREDSPGDPETRARSDELLISL